MICLTIILRKYDSSGSEPLMFYVHPCLTSRAAWEPTGSAACSFKMHNADAESSNLTSASQIPRKLRLWDDFHVEILNIFFFWWGARGKFNSFFGVSFTCPNGWTLDDYVAFQPPVKAMETFAKKHQDKVFRLALEDGVLEVLSLAMVAGFGKLHPREASMVGILFSFFCVVVDFCWANARNLLQNQSWDSRGEKHMDPFGTRVWNMQVLEEGVAYFYHQVGEPSWPWTQFLGDFKQSRW